LLESTPVHLMSQVFRLAGGGRVEPDPRADVAVKRDRAAVGIGDPASEHQAEAAVVWVRLLATALLRGCQASMQRSSPTVGNVSCPTAGIAAEVRRAHPAIVDHEGRSMARA
jgi:hypothetical protein